MTKRRRINDEGTSSPIYVDVIRKMSLNDENHRKNNVVKKRKISKELKKTCCHCKKEVDFNSKRKKNECKVEHVKNGEEWVTDGVRPGYGYGTYYTCFFQCCGKGVVCDDECSVERDFLELKNGRMHDTYCHVGYHNYVEEEVKAIMKKAKKQCERMVKRIKGSKKNYIQFVFIYIYVIFFLFFFIVPLKLSIAMELILVNMKE